MKKIIKKIILILILILAIFSILLIKYRNKKTEEEVTTFVHEIEKPNDNYSKPKSSYGYNEFEYSIVNTQNLINIYFNDYRGYLRSDLEKAYDLLDSEYKNKKFKNLEDYKKYIENNYDIIIGSSLTRYRLDVTDDDSNKYTCVYMDNKYFIIIEKAIMQYTVLLDDYVIDSEEFIEKYNGTDEQGKTVLNIQKFANALNDKSYYYAYNCLSQGFKDNYFKTQEDFENYVNENLFGGSFNIEYGSFDTESGLFKYSIELTNIENPEEKIEKTIIMRLNEGTDFEMSFDV